MAKKALRPPKGWIELKHGYWVNTKQIAYIARCGEDDSELFLTCMDWFCDGQAKKLYAGFAYDELKKRIMEALS